MKKIILCSLIAILTISLVGCSKGEYKQQINMSNKLSTTINKLNDTVKNIETITNADLKIEEIMNDNEIALTVSLPARRNRTTRQIVNYNGKNNGYNGATYTNGRRFIPTQTTNSLGNYVTKLESLHSVASDSISANCDCQGLKSEILSKTNSLKSLLGDIKSEKICLTDAQCSSIEDLIVNLNTYISRLNMTKNEVKNELAGVKKLKSIYSNNVEQLSSKYTRLINCLDTRCTYYSSIIGCLDGINDCILNGDTSKLLEEYLNQNNNDCDNNDCFYCKDGICYFCRDGICYYCKDGKCYPCEDGTCEPENLENENKEEVEDVAINNNTENFYPYENYYQNGMYGYGNGYYGFGNGIYGNNINTYRSIRNINTMDRKSNTRIKNTDTFQNVNSNIDSYKNEGNKKTEQIAKNTNDPYKIMPDMKTNNTNSKREDIKTSEVYDRKSPYGKNSAGYFRITKVEKSKDLENEKVEQQEDVNQNEIA